MNFYRALDGGLVAKLSGFLRGFRNAASFGRPHVRQAAGLLPQDPVCSSTASQHFKVRVVESFAGLSADERLAWKALYEKQPDPSPFQSLRWNEVWWEVFGRSSGLTSKSPVILVVTHHDEIIAFFPLFRQTISLLGIPLLRHVKPMGSDPNLTELKTGIVAEGRERDAYATLVEFFKHADRRWEILTIPAVPSGAEDPLCIPHPTQPVIEGFIIPLAADWDAFRSGLKRNVKEAVRKCYNSLKRDGIEPAFTCLSDSASIQDMLPEFYRLHAERGKQQDGVYHPDYFQLDKARTLISLLANDPAESGIRLFILRDGNRLIAARLAFETPRGIIFITPGSILSTESTVS